MSKKDSKGLVTKESICATGGLFSFAALFILCTRSLIFGDFGAAIHGFLTGVFGYCAYPLFMAIVYLCTTGLFGKRFVKDRLLATFVIFSCILFALAIHTATTLSWSMDDYVYRCFKSGEELSTVTVAGWLGGAVVYGVSKVVTQAGTLVFFVLFALVSIYACVRVAKRKKTVTEKKEKKSKEKTVKSVDIPLSQPIVAQNPAQAQSYVQPQAQQQSVAPQVQASAFPYANAVQQAEPVNAAIAPTVFSAVNPQNEQVNYTGNMMPTVMQRPGVSLSEGQPVSAPTQTAQPAVPTSFSPFGNAQTMPITDRSRPVFEKREGNDERNEVRNDYDTSNPRGFLFGGNPADNFRRNLLFDPTAKVNNMPVSEQPNALGGTSGFIPSYSDAYQNTINDNTQSNRAVNSFGERTFGASFTETRGERIETESCPTITPAPSFEPETRRENDSPYTLFGGSDSCLDVSESRAPREEISFNRDFSSERESSLPTGREGNDGSYSRHDYKDLFSLSNPNVFGRVEEEPENRFNESTPAENIFQRDFRDVGFSAGEENDVRDERVEERRDGFSLLDDDNPYALRSDYESERSPETGFQIDRNDRLDVADERVSDTPRMGFGREESGFSSSRLETENLVAPRMEQPIVPEPIITPRESIVSPVVAEPPKPVPQPPKPRVIRPYVRVRLDDLDCRDIEPTSNFEEVEETKSTIISTLQDFKVPDASIASVTFGPTVARYNVLFPRNIHPKKVVALDQSIAISLRSSGVNVYPNYEDGVVSIEVPNKERQFVQLGCMLSGDTFINSKSSSLMFAMGKDVANRKVYGDISKMIHLLVAGSSGSGKSVFLGSLIISLIYKYSPEELRLILIDPKKTEFVLYNDLPHLMINEIITDAHKAVQSLNWAIMEMNRRYGLFEQMSRSGAYVVNLDQYNAQVEKSKRLPKIVIIIDELADLMLAAKKEMEDRIQNLTQKARAAGIHLIVATQRPSTDVITGVIKSNLATRVAFYVATEVDSRVILDQSGAQKLLGKGDLLYTMPGVAAPIRVQSAFISTEESQKVVNFIKANNEAYYDEEATAYINSRGGYAGGDESFGGGGSAKDSDNVDPMYIEALRHVIACGSASISMIQRKCSAGYSRAGKIVEWMEDMGYISAFDGAKARKVLITKEEFESKYGPLE